MWEISTSGRDWLLTITRCCTDYKSYNLQYNTLVCWDKWIVDQASDVPSIGFFFHNFLQHSLQKSFQFIFSFFCKFTSYKCFECPKSLWEIIKKNNSCNMRRLVNESFVHTSKPAYHIVDCRILLFLAQKWSKGDDWYRWTLRRLWIYFFDIALL